LTARLSGRSLAVAERLPDIPTVVYQAPVETVGSAVRVPAITGTLIARAAAAQPVVITPPAMPTGKRRRKKWIPASAFADVARQATDNRTEAQRWLGDPPADRSALAHYIAKFGGNLDRRVMRQSDNSRPAMSIATRALETAAHKPTASARTSPCITCVCCSASLVCASLCAVACEPAWRASEVFPETGSALLRGSSLHFPRPNVWANELMI